jgi:hypothetical protein
MNGPQYSVDTSTDMYNRALGAGFHVAPVVDFDTHCSNYGAATRDRPVVPLTFSDAPLTSGATYFYSVTSVDAAGNVSAPSSIASVIVR